MFLKMSSLLILTLTVFSVLVIPSSAKLGKNCLAPPESGFCLGYFVRYYYDRSIDKCNEFIYGGCEGNENNYHTREQCEQACKRPLDYLHNVNHVTSITFFYILCINLRNSSCENFIINTDPGADDAVAIFTLLRHEATNPDREFKIIAFTCTYGNVEEKQAEINLLNILTVAGRKDIPVYGGAEKGFIEKYSSDYFYGRDGFGNMNLTDNNTIVQVDRSKYAAVALAELINKTPGNVSIINLGPTTNIALAISLDGNLLKHVHQIYQMGGAVRETGNKNPNVEFNFAADPESNFLLLNSSRRSQITMHPWENTLNTVVTKDWRKNDLGKYDSPYIDFLNKAERVSLSSMVSYWASSDALLAASIIESKIVIKQDTLNVYPVLVGESRGSVLVDYYKKTGRIENSNIVFESNATLFKEVLIRYLTCEEIPC